MMTLLERVMTFLREHSAVSFCDDCLDEILDLPSGKAKTATEPLGITELFDRGAHICSVCSRETIAVAYTDEPL